MNFPYNLSHLDLFFVLKRLNTLSGVSLINKINVVVMKA